MKGKIFGVLSAGVSLFCISCSSLNPVEPGTTNLESVTKTAYYENIQYVREGAGDKTFSIYRYGTKDPDLIILKLTQYDFNPVQQAIYVVRNETTSSLFDAVDQVFGEQPTTTKITKENECEPTGTWQHIFVVNTDGTSATVTDKELCQTLAGFETIVDEYMTELADSQ